jgi:hypothetical protein
MITCPSCTRKFNLGERVAIEARVYPVAPSGIIRELAVHVDCEQAAQREAANARMVLCVPSRARTRKPRSSQGAVGSA